MTDATGWMEEGQTVDPQAPLKPDSDMAEKPKTPFRRVFPAGRFAYIEHCYQRGIDAHECGSGSE